MCWLSAWLTKDVHSMEIRVYQNCKKSNYLQIFHDILNAEQFLMCQLSHETYWAEEGCGSRCRHHRFLSVNVESENGN